MKLWLMSFAALLAAAVLAVGARAGGENVKFPENYAKGVLYTTVDRADNKQYRELYSTPEAIAAVKAGQPIPSGTVLTLVQYKAKLDASGNPEKDANGRFIKGDLVAYTVMEKRTGWGKEYADDIRNGEWEYQAFKADKTVNDKAKLKQLLHLPQAVRQAGLRVLVPGHEEREVALLSGASAVSDPPGLTPASEPTHPRRRHSPRPHRRCRPRGCAPPRRPSRPPRS